MLGTECIRCFRAPSELTPSKALRSANGNCKIKAPDLNLQLLPPHPPKFNVELASVCQRSTLRGTDRPSNPSEKSTLSFGGRGLLFCRTRSRQILLYICFLHTCRFECQMGMEKAMSIKVKSQKRDDMKATEGRMSIETSLGKDGI